MDDLFVMDQKKEEVHAGKLLAIDEINNHSYSVAINFLRLRQSLEGQLKQHGTLKIEEIDLITNKGVEMLLQYTLFRENSGDEEMIEPFLDIYLDTHGYFSLSMENACVKINSHKQLSFLLDSTKKVECNVTLEPIIIRNEADEIGFNFILEKDNIRSLNELITCVSIIRKVVDSYFETFDVSVDKMPF